MPASSTIRAKPANSFKTKCNYCGSTGHWDKECHQKECGLSCKEAQADRKKGASDKKGKWKKKEKSEKTEEKSSVSTINVDNGSNPSPGTSEITKESSQSDSICFYIA